MYNYHVSFYTKQDEKQARKQGKTEVSLRHKYVKADTYDAVEDAMPKGEVYVEIRRASGRFNPERAMKRVMLPEVAPTPEAPVEKEVPAVTVQPARTHFGTPDGVFEVGFGPSPDTKPLLEPGTLEALSDVTFTFGGVSDEDIEQAEAASSGDFGPSISDTLVSIEKTLDHTGTATAVAIYESTDSLADAVEDQTYLLSETGIVVGAELSQCVDDLTTSVKRLTAAVVVGSLLGVAALLLTRD